jgi:hypothetical protein
MELTHDRRSRSWLYHTSAAAVTDGTHDDDDDELPTIKEWVIKETLLDAIVLAAQQKHGIDLSVGDARRLVSFVEGNLKCDPDKTLGPRPFAFFTEDGRFEEIDYMADYRTDWTAWTTTLSRNPYPNPFADPPAWLGVPGHLAVRRTWLDGAVTQALRQAGLLSASPTPTPTPTPTNKKVITQHLNNKMKAEIRTYRRDHPQAAGYRSVMNHLAGLGMHPPRQEVRDYLNPPKRDGSKQQS